MPEARIIKLTRAEKGVCVYETAPAILFRDTTLGAGEAVSCGTVVHAIPPPTRGSHLRGCHRQARPAVLPRRERGIPLQGGRCGHVVHVSRQQAVLALQRPGTPTSAVRIPFRVLPICGAMPPSAPPPTVRSGPGCRH